MCSPSLRFFQDIATDFIADRLDLVAARFVYPLPLYVGDALQVFASAEMFEEAIGIYRDAARKADIATLTPRLVASGIATRSNANLWIEWDHKDSQGKTRRISQVRYFLQKTTVGQPQLIEMIEYSDIAFPEASSEFMVATAF